MHRCASPRAIFNIAEPSYPGVAMARILFSRIAGALAVTLSLGSCALTLILAISLTIRHQRLYILALAAAIIQFLLLCTLAHLLVRYCLKGLQNISLQGERRNIFVLTLGILPSLVAGLVGGATFGWCKASVAHLPNKILGMKSDTFLLIGLLVWICSILAQVLFYSSLMWAGKSNNLSAHLENDEVSTLPEMMEQSQPSTSVRRSIPIHELPIPASSPPSIVTSEETSSRRSSFSTIQRPTSSKTRLLIRQHSFPRQSKRFLDHPAPSLSSQEGGFDSWDTSGVSSHIRETVLQSSPIIRGKPLEPIPGSRSPSPAKALEGPFFPQTELSSPPPSPLPQPSYSNYGSRQQAGSNEEDIHPLFRSCSPVPPPTASSNTVVTAAPGAGQLIDDGMLRRMRSGSLPTKPSPLINADSFDSSRNPGSIFSASQESPPPVPELQRPASAVPNSTVVRNI